MKLILSLCLLACVAGAQTNTTPASITLLATNAKHPSWCKINCGANPIVFHKLSSTPGVYQIWSAAADGTNPTCLSCTSYAQATLPGAVCGPSLNTLCQQGDPEWAPNGDIVFQQQRSGCAMTSGQATPGTGLCADLVECDQNFTSSCKTIATSGTGNASGFLQFRFSADGTKLFGGHVTASSGTCTAIFGEALAIRIFNWAGGGATQIVYTGPDTLNGDLLPAGYLPGNTCSSAFVEGATTYPTSIEPTTSTLFFSIVGDTTQAFRQYTMNISSGDAATILQTLAVVGPGGTEWSEMGKVNPGGFIYAYVSSTCTPDAPPVTINNVALDLALVIPGINKGTGIVCATSYNTPGSPMYYNKGNYVQFEDFDWGPVTNPNANSIVANVSDDSTFDNIYRYDFTFGSAVNGPVLRFGDPAVNIGSYTPKFTSGEWIAIFGDHLAPHSRTWTASDFVGTNLPTSLDGVSVLINGKPAYVEFISAGQVNVLAPDDTATGNITVQLTNAGVNSQTALVNRQAFAPAFFIFPAGGGKYVVATHGDNSLIGSASLFPGSSTPARVNEEIVMYGTGFGPGVSSASAGQLVTGPILLSNTVSVTIGGMNAPVVFAGLTESGLNQINVTVPAVPPGDWPVVATVGGAQTQANAYVTVQ